MAGKLLIKILLIGALACPVIARAENQGWSQPAQVTLGGEHCVTYKATIRADLLIVAAKHHHDWHSYAMDNDVRAEEQLAGKTSLGVEAPTTIEVAGVKTRGHWRQSEPVDMSQPEIRWYRWGFEGDAVFVTAIDPSSITDEVTVKVRGQVCDDKRCQQVNVKLELAAESISDQAAKELPTLLAVKKPKSSS